MNKLKGKYSKDLTQGPIIPLLTKLTWPMLFGMMGMVVFNMVDTFYVGRLGTADKFTGRSKGFGFVEMSDSEAANHAIEELNESEVKGRTIRVNESIERKDQDRRRGGFGGGNRGGGGGGNRGGDRGGDNFRSR